MFTTKHEKLVADDLGCVAIFTVPILPFAGLEFTVEVDIFSFRQILASYFCETCVEDDVGMSFSSRLLI